MASGHSRYSRRFIAVFWLLLISIIVGTLLYFEQIAVLYVLATLSLVLLLLVVGFADLENVGRENIEEYVGKEGNL
jgi:membrane protein YdbS with pleckstrin-like domain